MTHSASRLKKNFFLFFLVDGKVRKFTYYFVNYKGALNVAKYKIDHIRQKLEVREKDDIHRAFYRCSNEGCKRQYDVMDMGKIFDPFTQEMRFFFILDLEIGN